MCVCVCVREREREIVLGALTLPRKALVLRLKLNHVSCPRHLLNIG